MKTDRATTVDIFVSLGMAVFVPEADGRLVPVGELPTWWIHIDPEGGRRAPSFRPSSRHVFLAHFQQDAQQFFASGQVGVCDSGIWEYEVDEDTRYCLHIRALRLQDGSQFLVIQDLASSGVDLQRVIQRGRDSHMRILKDLAHRDQLEYELRRAQAAAERLNRAKTELLGKVSHELRTPLTSILGMAELGLSAATFEGMREYFAAIQQSGRYLQRLVEDLLDTSCLESGTLAIKSQPFDLEHVLEALRRAFQLRAASKGLQLEINCLPSVPQPAIMRGDADRTRQIITNLVDNAIRFTEFGEIVVTAERHPTEAELLRFTVRDTGLGIAEEEQQSIFDAFIKAQINRDDNYDGTGLGLSIASKLVVRMGGALSLQSKIGEGSLFLIDLPLLRPDSDASDDAMLAPPQVLGETTPDSAIICSVSVDSAPLRVLVAEDNAINRRFLRHALAKAGHHVTDVVDGEQAVEQVTRRGFDLLLIDCQMPTCDGFEATARIRAFEKTTGGYLPIVAITASATPHDLERCRAAGMDGYLCKPYEIEQLLAAIASVAPLRRNSLRPGSSSVH